MERQNSDERRVTSDGPSRASWTGVKNDAKIDT